MVIDLEGKSRLIEEIQEGDWGLARSEFESQGPLELQRVEKKFVRTAVVLELVIGGQKIKTTAEHPVYVPFLEHFVPVGELQVSDLLVSSQGTSIPIETITSLNEVTTVNNRRVADRYTYFVGGVLWGWDVWVHKASCAMRVLEESKKLGGPVDTKHLSKSKEHLKKRIRSGETNLATTFWCRNETETADRELLANAGGRIKN